ncbi:MAG: hypothetical protein RIQ49_134 [Pseudomonadota bacterium]|jgi:hypothetical protein
MNAAPGNKKAIYWERVRYDGSAQSSMYVVVNQGRLIMATTSLNLARQTFAKVRQGLDIQGLVGEHVESQATAAAANPPSADGKAPDQELTSEQSAA